MHNSYNTITIYKYLCNYFAWLEILHLYCIFGARFRFLPGFMFVTILYIYIQCKLHIYIYIHIYNTTSARCQGNTTTCTSGLAALVAKWKSTTSTSCNWCQPPPVQVKCLHQLNGGKTSQVQGAQVRASISASRYRMQQQHATTTTTTTEGPTIAGWMVGPEASCTDCCIVLCWCYLVGGGGCSCMLCCTVCGGTIS